MKITGFTVMNSEGGKVPADAFGNNVSFCCFGCGHPVLATALENQRGSDHGHPSECRGCGCSYFLDVRQQSEKIYIHGVSKEEALTRR